MDAHEIYMHRCLELAKLGIGYVAPNPMVGAVLVHQGRIIGEGYHKAYGQPHAEVNCLQSVKKEDEHLIKESTLYVSLEPCSHHGKTPPCTDLIIEKKIPEVIVGVRDPFKEVNGKGIEKLKAAGIKATSGILQEKCMELNKRFFTFHTADRPYILLKWAQTINGKMATADNSRLFISNSFSNRLVHKWRSEESSILVGTHTALQDDPSLTTRFWKGPNPIRLVVDMNLRLPHSLKVFDRTVKTIIFNTQKHEEENNLIYYKINAEISLVQQILEALHQMNIQSVLVEGGAKLLQSFIDENKWDEARVIINTTMFIPEGLAAPSLSNAIMEKKIDLFGDAIYYYVKP